MARRPGIKQGDLNRVLDALAKRGVTPTIEMLPSGVIRLHPTTPQVANDNVDAFLDAYEAEHGYD